MVKDDFYRYENNYMCWLKEAAFGMNDSVLDETNDAGDTGYRMPGRFITQPLIYVKRNRVYTRVSGVSDWGYIGNHGYQEGKMSLNMEMIDLSLFYHLFKACTTTDDTPSAGKYTHVYATTTARTTPPPSFAIYQRVTNTDTNQNIYWLYTGCEVNSFAIDMPLTGPATLSIDIRFRNCVTATALTSEPAFGTQKPYTLDETSVIYAKGGTSYFGGCHGFTITYIDGTVLHKPANTLYPSGAFNGNRDIKVKLQFAPWELLCLSDSVVSPLAPATASDLDITIKMFRDATNDYTQFAFEKLWCINTPDGTWDFTIDATTFLNHTPEFIIKPTAFEAGAVLTITEVNALDDDRYEG